MTQRRARPPGRGRGELLSATRGMALGTLASRGTGFVRTLIIAAAIGKTIGDAYNIANTIPNIIYELLLGGVLTSVVVPLIVSAARRDGDRGEAYAQRLLTLVVAGLAAASILGVAFAPLISRAYFGSGPEVARRVALATVFARFFLPQIFFYGVGALLGAILNARGSFTPPMWAPVLNNLVVILTGGAFIVLTSVAQVKAGQLTPGQELLLGGGTTLGIVAQTAALLPALRLVRFRLRLRWDLRGVGLAHAARLAGWVFVYVLANQVAYLGITRLAAQSSYGGAAGGVYSIYTYAFILVLLPHSVVAVSVITALLPRMSANAAEGRHRAVADDLAHGIKLSAVVLVPAALASIALGPLIGTALFAHHANSLSTGRLIGATLAGYAVSLVPFSAFQLQLRAFYALHDTRTPALVNIALAAINLAVDVFLFALLPPREQVVGLALGYSASYIAGFAWFSVLLRRRLGQHPRARVGRTLVRLTLAASLAVVPAYLLAKMVTAVMGLGMAGSLLGLGAGVAVGAPAYLALAERMHIPELAEVSDLARARWRP